MRQMFDRDSDREGILSGMYGGTEKGRMIGREERVRESVVTGGVGCMVVVWVQGAEGGGNATSLVCCRFFRSQPKTVSSDESGDSKMEVSHLGSLGKI